MSLLTFLKKPSVKLIAGITIFIGTNILVAKGTARYVRKIDSMDHVPDTKEKAALLAKCYGPAVGTAVVAAGAILSSGNDYVKTQNKLVNNVNLINTKYKSQKDAILNTLGVKDLLKIEEKTVEEVKHHPYSGNIEVQIEGYDERVETTMEELMDAELQFEKKFSMTNEISIGYLQELLGMQVDLNAKGFNAEYLYDTTGNCWVDMDMELVLEDNNQYYIITFPQEPIAEWMIDPHQNQVV